MTLEEYEKDGHPIREFGRRRDSSLDWVVRRTATYRCFRHLTEEAIRSYFLHLPQTKWGHYAVRLDGAKKQWQTLRTTSRECPTCHHREYASSGRWVHAFPDAATKVGRNAFAGRLAFDVLNAQRRLAWRLGVSCVVCGVFCGRRVRLTYDRGSVLGFGEFDVLCAQCSTNEVRDAKKWRRDNGPRGSVPEEWLLLMAVERQRRKVGRA